MQDPTIAVISTILTALCAAVGKLWMQNKKIVATQMEWKEKRIQTLEEEAKKDEEKIAELEQRISELEKDRAMMEARFIAFRSSHDSSPLPMWIKDSEGRVLACNKAYERAFLLPRGRTLMEYIGKKDVDVWPEHVAKQFVQNDQTVFRTRKIHDFIEHVTNDKGEDEPIRVIKYPRLISGIEDPIGVAGIAILQDLSKTAI